MCTRWTVGFGTLLAFLLFAGTDQVAAAVLTVEKDGSGQFTTIHSAIEAANSFDEIRIGPGRYYDWIHLTKPGLVVTGTDRENCVVRLTWWMDHAGLWASDSAGAESPTIRNLTLLPGNSVDDEVGLRIENCIVRSEDSSAPLILTSPFRSTRFIDCTIRDALFEVRGPRQVLFEDCRLVGRTTWFFYSNVASAPGRGSFRLTRCAIGPAGILNFSGGGLPFGIFDSTFESGMVSESGDLNLSNSEFAGAVEFRNGKVTATGARFGGFVDLRAGTLTATDCEFADGVTVGDADVTLERCTVLAEATAFGAEAGSQITATDVTFESEHGSSLVLAGDSSLDATRLRLLTRASEVDALEANVVVDGSQLNLEGGALEGHGDFQLLLTGFHRVQVSGVRIAAGRVTTIHARSWGPLTIRGSHILFGPGLAASFGPTVPGILNPDLRENFWGTSDLAAIADAIYDGPDFGCPTCAIVLFEPIAVNPVKTSRSTFGALKAGFQE